MSTEAVPILSRAGDPRVRRPARRRCYLVLVALAAAVLRDAPTSLADLPLLICTAPGWFSPRSLHVGLLVESWRLMLLFLLPLWCFSTLDS